MALPPSGQISISDIRAELLNTGKTVNYNLARAGAPYGVARDAGYVPLNESATYKPDMSYTPGGTSRPVSTWYGYDHSSILSCPIGFVTPNVTGGNYIYYKVTISGTTGTYTPIYSTVIAPDANVYTFRIYTSYPFDNTGSITASPIYTGNGNDVYWYQLTSSSDILYFVFWNTSVL